MSFLLTVIGALVALLGVAAIGFGIPINEFSLGNTLIISGTTAVAGGLILVALAAALRQLTRIAEALTRQTPRPQHAGEPAETAMPRPAPAPVPPSPRVPFPPKPPNRDSREAAADMRVPEPPRPLGAPPMVAEDRTRPRFPPPPLSEDTAELDEPVLLPPQGAAPPVFPPPPTAAPAAAAAPSRETLMPSARAEARSDEGRAVGSAAVDVTRGPRLDPPWKPTLPAEREAAGGPERTRGLFDSLWPVDRGRKDAEPRKDDITGLGEPPEPRERRQEEPRERRQEDKATDLGMAAVGEALAKGLEPEPAAPEPADLRAEPAKEIARPEPVEALEPAKPAEPPRSVEPAPVARGAAPAAAGPVDRTVTILKSGVVDGMAYTLYSDGSIEAELPEGTIRFTSIEDLRRHLDTHS